MKIVRVKILSSSTVADENFLAVAIDTNLLVALRATKLLLTPTQSRVYIFDNSTVSIKSCESLLSIIT